MNSVAMINVKFKEEFTIVEVLTDPESSLLPTVLEIRLQGAPKNIHTQVELATMWL